MALEILNKFPKYKGSNDHRDTINKELCHGEIQVKNYRNKLQQMRLGRTEEVIVFQDEGTQELHQSSVCLKGEAMKDEKLQARCGEQKRSRTDSRERKAIKEQSEHKSCQVNFTSQQLPLSSQIEGHNINATKDHLLPTQSCNTPSLTWRDGCRSPFALIRGGAAVKGNMAYFMDWSGRICSYDSTSKKWRRCPKYPYQYGSLVVVGGAVTAVGGCSDFCKESAYTNTLLSLQQDSQWKALYPPMSTKRRDATAIATREHLIVAGGMTGAFINSSLANVEVMDISSQVWSSAASLPHPLTSASAAIVGNQLFLLGGWDEEGMTKSVFSCLLTELLRQSSTSTSVWDRVADTASYSSTCAAVSGELLTVGGSDKEGKATNAVQKYNPLTDTWDCISEMKTARYCSVVAVLSTNEMIVAGGDVQWNNSTNRVELATFDLLLH